MIAGYFQKKATHILNRRTKMGFDFVNTRITGATGPVTVSSGSISYQTLNSNINLATCSPLGISGSGSIIVRNGLIVGVVTISSSTQPY